MEEWDGDSIVRILIALREAGAPDVIFELEDAYVRAIFPRHGDMMTN
jgi:hypothetical protein